MKSTILSTLQSKGFSGIIRKNNQKIEKFDVTDYAQKLFTFLRKDVTCRVAFSALLKTNFFNNDKVLKNVNESLKNIGTSFVRKAICQAQRCHTQLERLNLADEDFEPTSKHMNCNKCSQRNELSPDNYAQDFGITQNDLMKLLHFGFRMGAFQVNYHTACFKCSKATYVTKFNEASFTCSKCKKLKFVTTEYIVPDASVDNLIENKLGRWFEWYCWKLIKNGINCQPNVIVKKGNQEVLEADILLEKDGKIGLIECKDREDCSDILAKLPDIKRIANVFILVSASSRAENKVLAAIKAKLGNKFVWVSPEKVHELNTIVHSKLN